MCGLRGWCVAGCEGGGCIGDLGDLGAACSALRVLQLNGLAWLLQLNELLQLNGLPKTCALGLLLPLLPRSSWLTLSGSLSVGGFRGSAPSAGPGCCAAHTGGFSASVEPLSFSAFAGAAGALTHAPW